MTFLLIIIYIAFISLGLPDAIQGSAWPIMHLDINAPLSAAGIVALVTSGSTIISSLVSCSLINRLKTGKLTMISVLMTALALLGLSYSKSLWYMCLFSVPLGLGAGGVDAALNNFVALHYKARYMNWLHCFWGVGATLGPVIMSFFLAQKQGWQMAYKVIFLLQIILTAVLFFTLPLWKKVENQNESHEDVEQPVSSLKAFKIKGIKVVLLGFFCYCGYEWAVVTWTASFFVTTAHS